MSVCNARCACGGGECRRNDEHGEQHACSTTCQATCSQCGHRTLWHRFDSDTGRFECDERMSYDNNDFCRCKHGLPKPTPLKPRADGEPLAVFFAVRNPATGEYYRTYNKNRRAGWVPKLEDARLWTKVSQAKSNITALSHGSGPVPELVEFIVREVNVVDQKARVAEAKRKQAEEEAKRQASMKEEALRHAQSEFDRAKSRLEKLRRE